MQATLCFAPHPLRALALCNGPRPSSPGGELASAYSQLRATVGQSTSTGIAMQSAKAIRVCCKHGLVVGLTFRLLEPKSVGSVFLRDCRRFPQLSQRARHRDRTHAPLVWVKHCCGQCQSNLACGNRPGLIACADKQSIVLFQDVSRNHPARRHDVRPLSTVVASG
jgi:hypothetical protein